MRYEFRLVDVAAIYQQEDGTLSFNPDERLAAWPITAYGKTPTAFLQTDEEAVNLAAVVALRDAARTSSPHSAPRPTSQSGSTVSLDASRR